jgi:hypothetical protein
LYDFITGFTTGEKPDDVGVTAFDGAGAFLVVVFEFSDEMFRVELD